MLSERADAYARVALRNIEREFPHSEHLYQSRPGPVPRPRDLHPAFYGSLDWHSCVEMHWVLAGRCVSCRTGSRWTRSEPRSTHT